MLITTANDLPGFEITETLGEVFGLTVRSRNIGSQLGAGLKSIMGGELKGMTQALVDSREQVIERMVEEANAKGADAIVAMRFDTSDMGNNWTEICAYGTAVGRTVQDARASRTSRLDVSLDSGLALAVEALQDAEAWQVIGPSRVAVFAGYGGDGPSIWDDSCPVFSFGGTE